MSSENDSYASTPPRIRQFGLYKSIDCKTEEFLRLSRRRQIRQGCACAAVSTAITVTVVIVMIFIYEFSFNSEVAAVRTKLRPNWFSFMNDTTEDSFEKRYTKSNIDKTSLTLLPILINALKKNVFLDKVFEEQSSPRPNTESRETTEYSINKNVFTKNFFKNPSSSLYTIAFKTFPIDSTRATTNQAYFTKIRKIRDYQRIFNYFDKMINDKAYLGSSRPMGSMESVTDKAVNIKQKAKKYYHKNHPKIQLPQVARSRKYENKGDNESKDCKCMIKLGNLLHRFLSVIQILLPQASNKLNSQPENDFLNEPLYGPINDLDFEPINEPDNEPVENLKTNKKYKDSVPNHHRKHDYVDQKPERFYKPDENSVVVPEFLRKTQKLTENNREEASIDSHIESIENSGVILNRQKYSNLDKHTQTTTMINKNKYNKLMDDNSIVHFLDKNNEIIRKQIPEIKIFSVDDVYSGKTMDGKKLDLVREETVNRLKHLNHDHKQSAPNTTTSYPQTTKLPIHTLIRSLNKTIYQLIKNNNIQQIAVDENLIQPTANRSKLSIERNEDKKDQGRIQEPNPSVLTREQKVHLVGSIDESKNTKPIPTKRDPSLTKEWKKSRPFQEKFKKKNSTANNQTKTSKSNDKQLVLGEESIQNEVNSSYIPNKKNESTNKKNTKSPDIIWEVLNNENIPAYKSMTPKHRPIFLEIQQKSDWKQDHDDDYNILNNYDFST